jgi:hypothetical protein
VAASDALVTIIALGAIASVTRAIIIVSRSCIDPNADAARACTQINALG